MDKTWSIWFEPLYHYTCPHCGKWTSVSTIAPVAGKGVPCMHCGQYSKVPLKLLTKDEHGEEWALSGFRMVDPEVVTRSSPPAIATDPEAPTGP